MDSPAAHIGADSEIYDSDQYFRARLEAQKVRRYRNEKRAHDLDRYFVFLHRNA